MSDVTVPFRRVLVANRGEIALRIIRACREMGIEPVAVYGDGEEQSIHVRAAADAYRIPAGSTLPYLNGSALIEIANRSEARAIHPGYGFLAENAAFAEACEAAGLIFVGPAPAALRAMGDKVEARKIAVAAGVPVTPGSDGPVIDVAAARASARIVGYPVAVKASGGGGGRGFRVAGTENDLEEAFLGASGEASRYFANPEVYLERYLERPRHVEVQVFGDRHGNVVALGERDCSVQRRHQKLIEETPSPAIDNATRQAMWAAGVALARAVRYEGAGTCEFLVAEDGTFAFLEMNARIQVEHTVTEEVTGVDLVKEQLRVAAGMPLSFRQDEVVPRGHAIQCRINAEDPGRDFAPVPGVIRGWHVPDGPGVRVDTAIEVGAAVSPSYDSLLAKLVVWGRDREEAIARMRRALDEFVVEGVTTTLALHKRVIAHPAFRGGVVTTAFLSDYPDVIPDPASSGEREQVDANQHRDILVEVGGRRLTVRLPADFSPRPNQPIPVRRSAASDRPASAVSSVSGPELRSPLQGTVLRVAVTAGQVVAHGELVCVVEAMKMENEILAHRSGVLGTLGVKDGDAVTIGALLATIEQIDGERDPALAGES